MVTVDCHLHLTESSEQAPLWWMEGLYRPYVGDYIWTDGAAIVRILDRAGVDDPAPVVDHNHRSSGDEQIASLCVRCNESLP